MRVVLLDLRLSGGDGAAVFRRVRGGNPSARVILITGYGDEMGPLVGELLAEGVDAVRSKPFDVPQLLEHVVHLAGGAVGH
jgi:CheY-like chemotaxis protein